MMFEDTHDTLTATAPAPPRLRRAVLQYEEKPQFVPIVTFVLWAVCFVVGVAGLVLPYPRPQGPVQAPAPVQAQIVNVEVAKAPPPPPVEMPPPELGAPDLSSPPAPQNISVPQSPAIAVAAPSPAISFAVPVEGLTRIVDPNQAAHGRPGTPSAITSNSSSSGTGQPGNGVVPAVTHLTFGEGEGKQPPPEYPRDAVVAGQEGNVGLRFTVDETGRVKSVSTISPCHWPLLNQAATRAVREYWRFAPGPVRSYEVTIQFELQK
jgi:protein TonB